MMQMHIQNETANLNAVLVGIADDFGGTPSLDDCYDPKSKQHVLAGTYPTQRDCIAELHALLQVFEKYDVEVFRPENIKGLNQIFSRDIAFVIEDVLVLPNIIQQRRRELAAIGELLAMVGSEKTLSMPPEARAEGGDVMPWNEYIFVGYSGEEDFDKYTSARTNKPGLDFLTYSFPSKIIKGFELNKSDDDPKENALHLDCCFQPIGKGKAIIYKGGFKHVADVEFLINYFGKENIVEITQEEMYEMNSNIFSISEEVIVSEKGFTRLNTLLQGEGFIVEEVPYAEIGKMEGLLRCSTMPLIRAT
ncbi:MAG: amidinotransferase [Planctomycetes bacterium]|nr:amidinotransferase [Planctomycetota bacterium]